MRTRITLLFLPLLLGARAQVACDILAPDAMHANLVHTWAEPANGSWNTPDMTQVANRVTGDLAMAVDLSAADSLCCAPVGDPASVDGKIALLYRGTCDFSEKAKHCQDAGAIAVVIINNVPGAPAAMGGGSQGELVNIPVFQIGANDGAMLRSALEAGTTVTLLLGNKSGYYNSDIGFNKQGILLPPSLAHPALLAANAGEYNVQMGAWVHNFGSQNRTGVILTATVTQDLPTIYDQSSAAFDLDAGDSVFVQLPDFGQSTYEGRYLITYNASSLDADEHTMDNTFSVPLDFGAVYSLAPLDDDTDVPVTTVGTKPATPTGEYESCIHFRDANAGRIAVTGFDRYASINAPATLENELIITRVYQWLDGFTGLSDPAFDISTLIEVHAQEHILTETDGQTQVFLPFDVPLVLEDDIRYLFCTSVFNQAIFLGYNENVHYGTNEQVYDQPTCPNRNGSNWFVGFTGRPVASLGARTIDAQTIGIEEAGELEVGAFPNPGNGSFQVLLGSAAAVEMTVTDATGRVVLRQRSAGDRAVIDITGSAAGVYLLTVEGERGRAAMRLVKD